MANGQIHIIKAQSNTNTAKYYAVLFSSYLLFVPWRWMITRAWIGHACTIAYFGVFYRKNADFDQKYIPSAFFNILKSEDNFWGEDHFLHPHYFEDTISICKKFFLQKNFIYWTFYRHVCMHILASYCAWLSEPCWSPFSLVHKAQNTTKKQTKRNDCLRCKNPFPILILLLHVIFLLPILECSVAWLVYKNRSRRKMCPNR